MVFRFLHCSSFSQYDFSPSVNYRKKQRYSNISRHTSMEATFTVAKPCLIVTSCLVLSVSSNTTYTVSKQNKALAYTRFRMKEKWENSHVNGRVKLKGMQGFDVG